MPYLSLSLCYLFLLAVLIFLLSLGLVVTNEFYPNTFQLSATSANKLFAIAGSALIAIVAVAGLYVMFILVPAIGGGMHAH